MKAPRFLKSEALSRCHNSPSLLVLSRKGGLISQILFEVRQARLRLDPSPPKTQVRRLSYWGPRGGHKSRWELSVRVSRLRSRLEPARSASPLVGVVQLLWALRRDGASLTGNAEDQLHRFSWCQIKCPPRRDVPVGILFFAKNLLNRSRLSVLSLRLHAHFV